jgi:hypothetical protein
VLTSPFSELNATFSADGRWIAYQSNETGRYEIYVQSYPSSGGKWQVSTAGGGQPRWRDDGRELFYLDGTRRLMSVPIEVEGSNFKPGVPKALFDSHAALTGGLGNIFVPYTVTKDGQRFVVGAAIKDTEVVPMTIVVNWMAGLKK